MSTLVMTDGSQNLEGQRRGSLVIERIASRRPLRWAVRCINDTCNLRTVVDHVKLQNGTVKNCPNPQCGKASSARQSIGSVGQQVPLNRSAVSDEARRFHAEETENEALMQRETNERRSVEKQAKIDEQTQIVKANNRAYLKELLTTGPDPMFYVSPEMRHASMPTAEVQKFNGEQSAEFVKSTPEYAEYKSNDTLNAIINYFARNGVRIFDVDTLRAAFNRLKDTGMIQKCPVPQAEPASRPQPVKVNLTFEPSGPELESGWDDSGKPLSLTKREVDKLSADEYRVFKRLDRAALDDSLPRIGPGPRGRR
jgi:hypothetical protein